MDSSGNIYPLSDLSEDQLDKVEIVEDVARLDGFLRGRAEAVKLYRARKYETLVFDSSGGKTYRKDNTMGIENVEEIGNSAAEDDIDVDDPGTSGGDEPVSSPESEPDDDPGTSGGDESEPDDDPGTSGGDEPEPDDEDSGEPAEALIEFTPGESGEPVEGLTRTPDVVSSRRSPEPPEAA
jgi:hypothetical protein